MVAGTEPRKRLSRTSRTSLSPEGDPLPPPPDVEAKGMVLQRFPATDWRLTPLPMAIEMFCQPLGWYLTYIPPSPSFINFILTAEDGSRLYCTCLNFYQLQQQAQRSKRRFVSTPTIGVTELEALSKRRGKSCKDWNSVDYLDEGNEVNWSLEDVWEVPDEAYEPLSLCVVSKFPLFDTLQNCLKAIYVSWIGDQPLEPLIAELLTTTHVPSVHCSPVRKKFGALKELVLHPIHEESALPYTSTAAIRLLRSIGTHNMLQLLASLLCDTSVLVISSCYTALTSAIQALWSIIHPLTISHSLVPVVPERLLDYVQLPSTYIMGIHSSLRKKADEMGDTVEVYLDDGHVILPEGMSLSPFPTELFGPLRGALARILDPGVEVQDRVFQSSPGAAKSLELQDKEVRAVFLCLFVSLLGDFQHYTTVIRVHPQPSFWFNKDAYLAKHGSENAGSLIHKMTDSIAFTNFTYERCIPFRVCDFFDELVAKLVSHPEDFSPKKLFSQSHIKKLSEKLLNLLPPCGTSDDSFDTKGMTREQLETPCKCFPTLREAEIGAAIQEHESKEEEAGKQERTGGGKRNIPLLNAETHHLKKSSSYLRDIDLLINCLDAIFQNKILEARKYIPTVTQTLKSGIVSDSLVPELVDHIMEFGVLLGTEQFDLIVKVMNSALVDEKSAMNLLPMTTIIYREINPGVPQYVCTCLQNHHIWGKLEFWKEALYAAIQAELVRIYSEGETRDMDSRRMTDIGSVEDDEGDTVPEIGDITLRSRQRIRSTAPAVNRARMRATQRVGLSRSTRVRMRASTAIPKVSEGVLPPEAEPVTSQEALHHLAKQLSLWPTLSEERKMTLTRQEENAVQNQIILFVQRIINLRTPVEFLGGVEEQNIFTSELEGFIGRLLRMVEVNLRFDFTEHGKIREQIHDMIVIHLDSLVGLRKELKRLPIAKVKIIKPPLLPGEVTVLEGIHTYLLPDGRENGLLAPAEGHIFLTSYRVIFLGTPCDPHAPNVIVTRSMPVASIFRLKKLQQYPLPQLGITTVSGLQMRSTTAELIRIGFDEDVSQMDIKNVLDKILTLRNPPKITRGLKSTPPPSPDSSISGQFTGRELPLLKGRGKTERSRGFERSNILSGNDTLTRVKMLSDLSLSPCCQEYNRMGLGNLTFTASNRGPWKVTAINMNYPVCSSYPAVLVVPDKITDNSLISMAHQFQHNRFPVVTWKHPKKQAVLLRSSSFIPSSIAKKTVSTSALGYVQSSINPNAAKTPGDAVTGNVGGVGVSNIEVENYLLSVLLINQIERNQKDNLDESNLVLQLSIPPRAMEFDTELHRTASASSTSSNLSNPATPKKDHKPLSNQLSSASAASAVSAGSIDSGLGGDTVQQQVPSKAASNGGSPEANRKGKGTASKLFRKFSKHGLLSSKNSKASKGAVEKKRKTQSESSNSPEIARKSIESDSVTDVPSERAELGTGDGCSPVDASEKNIESDVSDTPKGSPDLSADRKVDNTSPSSSPQPTRIEGSQSSNESPEQVRKLSAENGVSVLPRLTEETPGSPIGTSRWSRKAVKKASPKLSQKVVHVPKEKLESPPSSPTVKSPVFEKEERAKSPVDGLAENLSSNGIELDDVVVEVKRATSTSPIPSGQEPAIDWEAVGEDSRTSTPVQAGEGHFRTSTPEGASSPELTDRKADNHLELNWKHFQNSQEIQMLQEAGVDFSPGSFSSIPTNPRDWIVVDALPEHINHWQANALYIIGDKVVLQDIPEDLYPNCMFVPVEIPSLSDVSISFKKLMRGCSPSPLHTSSYMAAAEESGWINQLSTIMQLAGAVADLIDIQSSSVLVCLENGWDATAQVVSLAQILLDPYYRTLEGFKALVEKDWLSFGHKFSQKGNQTTSSHISDFAPLFLQFLDTVHQVMKQFPLSFEFNDFYLCMLAYHHASLRFHTFTMDSEKERLANNWLPYRPRPANIHGSSGHSEPYASYWEHVERLHNNSMLFYNFKYLPQEDAGPLRPHSYQANLDIWSFYLENNLSQFPPYDTELTSDGELTLLDMHHNIFEKDKDRSLMRLAVPTDLPGLVTSEISRLLRQYSALMNNLAVRQGLPVATWMELWDELQSSTGVTLPMSLAIPVDKVDSQIVSHGQTLHKRTTLAVLIKGKLSVELEQRFTHPHQFESHDLSAQHECAFCKHQIFVKQVLKCKKCGCMCHPHCKALMPYNCGQKNLPLSRGGTLTHKKPKEYPERTHRSRLASSTFYSGKSTDEPRHSEGYLYKRGKIVKNWKLRWFILDMDKRELIYYDSKHEVSCKGSISLNEIQSVEEAEPQIVPALKPGEAGFFFNLITPKRIFHLMALRNSARSEWIARITTAVQRIR